MEKSKIALRFSRACHSYDGAARVQDQMATRLLDLLDACSVADGEGVRRWQNVAETGCGTGLLSRQIRLRYRPGHYWLNDLCPSLVGRYAEWPEATFVPGDMETVPLPQTVDLLAANAAIQWLAEPERFFSRCAQALQPGGRVAFTSFGPDTFREIRHLTGQGLRYLTARDYETLLQHAGLEVEVCEERTARLTFAQPLDVLRHLKLTGVTAAGHYVWTPRRLEAFCQDYRRLYATADGRVTLTYCPIYMIAKK